MFPSITRRAAAVLLALGTAGSVALGLVASEANAATTASSARAGTVSTEDTAGVQLTGGQFRYVQVTTYARSLGQYNATMGAGFGHGITLISATKTVSLGMSVYKGETAASPWDEAFDVTNTPDGSQVGGCLAGNPAGTGGVTCNTSTTGEPGAFAPGAVTYSLYYNKANGVLDFDAYQGSNDFHGFINVGPGLSFYQADLGTTLANPTTVTPPKAAQLLGRSSDFTVTNYRGTRFYSLTSRSFQTSLVQATGAGSVKIATAALSDGGKQIATYLQP